MAVKLNRGGGFLLINGFRSSPSILLQPERAYIQDSPTAFLGTSSQKNTKLKAQANKAFSTVKTATTQSEPDETRRKKTNSMMRYGQD